MKLELKNISKKFRKNDVLNDISVEFKPGNIYGLIGTNGSGKSVLFKLICGVMQPTFGNILFDDEDYLKTHGVPKSTRAIIESPNFIGSLSGFDNLKMIAKIQNRISDEDIKNVLKKVGLENEMNKKVNNYSMGMKQKLAIAQVIMEEEELILLDEPFNGLDFKSIDEIRNLILALKNKNRIIIVASHIKEDFVKLADKLYLLDKGKLSEYDKKQL